MTRDALRRLSVQQAADFVIEHPEHELAEEAMRDLARLFGICDDNTNERIAQAVGAFSKLRRETRRAAT